MFVTLRTEVFADASGASREIPCIWTPVGWLEPLVDYFLEEAQGRSVAWMQKVARAVTLFLHYMLANPEQQDPKVLFMNFAASLNTGTFNRLSGLDPSWLCWDPMSPSEVRGTVVRLSDFLTWLSTKNPSAGAFLPLYEGSAYSRMMAEKAYQFRRKRAFLGHIWQPTLTDAGKNRLIRDGEPVFRVYRGPRAPHVSSQEPPAFPEEAFPKFLWEGFKVGGKLNYRDMLITLLLHGAGFRASEPFHLYFGDVVEDPDDRGKALVLIHHPEFGTPPGGKKGNRKGYLEKEFGLSPRNLLMNSQGAGWKGGAHDAKYYMRAWWFIPEFGEWFLKIWKLYLEQVGNTLKGPLAHPYAWVNMGREPQGGMYCMGQYVKAHARACERLGLTVGKSLGTTPHGHRHAFGRRLVGGEFTREERRKLMHHIDPFSQDVYTTPTTAETLASLRQGLLRLGGLYLPNTQISSIEMR